MTEKNILCVDIGTSSLKAAVINQSGTVIASSRRPFLLYHTLHASKEWLPCLQNAMSEIFSAHAELKVDGICISGNGPTLVAPSGETYLWSDPADLTGMKEEIKQTKSLFIPRLLSFKKKFESLWEESDTIFSGPEYLIYLLTQKKFTILPSKRFYDYYWTDDELIKAGFSQYECRKLPEFIFSGSLAGTLDRKSESFLGFEANGIKEGAPVYCGAPDFISALIGTGTVKAGMLCDRAGSSEGLNFCTEHPVYQKGLRTMPSIIDGLWNVSVLINESGSRFYDFKQKAERENGCEYDFNEFVKNCLTTEGNNITFETGKSIMTETAELLKDAACLLRDAALMQDNPVELPSSMTITGGQSANELWVQFKADITEMSINVPECPDAELLGDAILAFKGMGLYSSIQEGCDAMCRTGRTFTPVPAEDFPEED